MLLNIVARRGVEILTSFHFSDRIEPAEAVAEAPAEGANAQIPQGPFLAFVKEVQMLVVGFVTSLLPGFHPHAD